MYNGYKVGDIVELTHTLGRYGNITSDRAKVTKVIFPNKLYECEVEFLEGEGETSVDYLNFTDCEILGLYYNIGDRVKITDPGKQYETYIDWFRENGLEEYEWEYSNKECNRDSKDMFGVVKGVGKHRESDEILIYIELNNGNVILIGEDGVERSLEDIFTISVDGEDIGTLTYGSLNASDFHSGVINSKEECKMNFTKDDLKTGMVLEDKNGDKMKVMLNTEYEDIVTWESNTWTELDHYGYNLTHKLGGSDIIKVYVPKGCHLIKSFEDEDLYLIWEREGAKYYLYSDHLDDYLNYNVIFEKFSMGSILETNEFKTKFTDAEIRKFKIPVDKYKKIKC